MDPTKLPNWKPARSGVQSQGWDGNITYNPDGEKNIRYREDIPFNESIDDDDCE